MKSWFGLIAILLVTGCSEAPAIVPPTAMRFNGEHIAFVPSRCRTANLQYLDIARSVIRQRFVDTNAMIVIARSEPRTLNVDICASFVPNGNEPGGYGYVEIFVAHVVIRATDARGAIRYHGAAQAEYRTSGKQGFKCGWIEIRRTGGIRVDRSGSRTVLREDIDSSTRSCPVSPEEAFVFAAQDAFNSIHKY